MPIATAVPGSVMPAVIAARRRRIERKYREAGATSPEAALAPEELGLRSWPHVRALARRGVLVEVAGSERYWLDEAEAARQHRRRRIAIGSVMGGLLVALLAALLVALALL